VSETIAWRSAGISGPLQVEYTLDAALTREVHRALSQGRVAMGHVIVLEPDSGRVLAYASTDVENFPGSRTYPAASLVKVITAAAALSASPETAKLPCRFTGSPYRLTPKRVDPPRSGTTVTLRKALATSNNQCFAQLAVHAVGARSLVAAIERFGWLARPAPAHAAGSVDVGEDRFDTAKLGCGLAGCQITPLHAAQLAASLADGELIAPRWVDRIVDGSGRELPLPAVAAPKRVMSPQLAAELREMLVDTTTRGTARSAFRRRNGRPKLGDIRVAGKTGSLSGTNPKGKYEWFIGVAPADDPKLAVASVVVHGDLWWRSASQLAADVLERAFCERGKCRPLHADRWMRGAAATAQAEPTDGMPSS
jgi:cell division protein FtsI/penicillin-binding protein 2